MAPTRECYGRCGNLSIRYRDRVRRHYLRVDREKLKECEDCPVFAKCMFLRYNKLIRDMIRMIDDLRPEDFFTIL